MKNGIKIIGVGNCGNNILNRIIDTNFDWAEFWAMNSDTVILETSKAQNKLQLGSKVACGLGCATDSEKGELAAEESKEEIKKALDGAKTVVIIAGYGCGIGTSATPLIAKIAQEIGATVIPVITLPFDFEGKKRKKTASDGIEKLKKLTQDIIVIDNQTVVNKLDTKITVYDAFSIVNEKISDAIKNMIRMIDNNTDIKTAVNNTKIFLSEFLAK